MISFRPLRPGAQPVAGAARRFIGVTRPTHRPRRVNLSDLLGSRQDDPTAKYFYKPVRFPNGVLQAQGSKVDQHVSVKWVGVGNKATHDVVIHHNKRYGFRDNLGTHFVYPSRHLTPVFEVIDLVEGGSKYYQVEATGPYLKVTEVGIEALKLTYLDAFNQLQGLLPAYQIFQRVRELNHDCFRREDHVINLGAGAEIAFSGKMIESFTQPQIDGVHVETTLAEDRQSIAFVFTPKNGDPQAFLRIYYMGYNWYCTNSEEH